MRVGEGSGFFAADVSLSDKSGFARDKGVGQRIPPCNATELIG